MQYVQALQTGEVRNLQLPAELPLMCSQLLHKDDNVRPEGCITRQSLCIFSKEADQAAERLPALPQQLPHQLQL